MRLLWGSDERINLWISKWFFRSWLVSAWDAPVSKARPWASRASEQDMTGLFGECLAGLRGGAVGAHGRALARLTVGCEIVTEDFLNMAYNKGPDSTGTSTPIVSFLPTTESPGFPLTSIPRLDYIASELKHPEVCLWRVVCTCILGYFLHLHPHYPCLLKEWERQRERFPEQGGI